MQQEMSAGVQESRLLTVRETAEKLAVSEKTVRRLIYAGILPAYRLGNGKGSHLRIDPAEVGAWLYGDDVA
jgi:excisionase family DNA binding protein